MGMIDMYSVKRKLESKVCPTHNERATVSVMGDKINLKCCCNSFQNSLSSLAQQEIAAQSKKYVEDQLRKAFKR